MPQTQTTPNHPADDVTLLDDAARGSVVTYLPRFLVEAEADALFAELCANTPFHTEAPVMFGRVSALTRLDPSVLTSSDPSVPALIACAVGPCS